MTTTFDAELPILSIDKHPNNPRRRAVADDDLVESVRVNGLIEPLIVVRADSANSSAPRYLLIAGHRRLDACKKAKQTTAPAIVRTDLVTEGQQLEAMLVENDNRQDLSPIEQAEGYQQLALFGYTQKAIAAAVGKDPKTVRARLQLLKLRKPTQTKIHAGQLAIDDALALVEFADDPAITKNLESELTSQYGNFKYALQRARARRKEETAVDKAIADYKAAGVKEYKLPKGTTSLYQLPDATRTNQVGVDIDQHTDCLAYAVIPATSYSARQVDTVCTDPARHTDQLDAEQARRVAERDQERAAREARLQAGEASARVRIDSAVSVTELEVLPTQLQGLVRALLPALLVGLREDALNVYLHLMHVRAARSWTNRWYSGEKDKNGPLLQQHLDAIDGWSPLQLTRALTAVLAVTADETATKKWDRVDLVAARYLDFLERVGHTFTDVDQELADQVRGAGVDEPAQAAS